MTECSKCGGTDIAMILWGLPNMSSELEKKVKDKKIVLVVAVLVVMTLLLNAMTADGDIKNEYT